MDNRRLRGVVHGLHLRDVDDASADARRADEAAREVVLQRAAVRRRALPVLPPPVQRRRLGAEERAVDVDAQHAGHGVQRPVEERALLPRDARVGHEHVQPPAELAHDLVHRRLDRLVRVDVDLVRLACHVVCFS